MSIKWEGAKEQVSPVTAIYTFFTAGRQKPVKRSPNAFYAADMVQSRSPHLYAIPSCEVQKLLDDFQSVVD